MGAILYLNMVFVGESLVLDSPQLSLVSMAFLGTCGGLLMGVLMSLRPERRTIQGHLRAGLDHGYWALVTRPMTTRQISHVEAELSRFDAQVVRAI